MTVAELGSRLSSREFAEWLALEALDREQAVRDELARRAAAGLEAQKGRR